jgi:peptidoglycan hydrolase-like protein with peptidoglycan-binding domain
MLRSGSRGPEVEDLQRALMRKGINPGPIDGAFGPKTEDAVRRFQERAGLVADGIAGPKTLGALEEKEAGGIVREPADEKPDQGPPKQAL